MIEKQKGEPGDMLVSAALFDDRTEILYDRVDIKDVKPMTDKEYYVRGCTALLDAVGGAIEHIKEVRKEVPKEERPEKTIFIITTDGMENASKKYSYDKVKSLIEKRKTKNWEFIFLGANIDAAKEAGRIGIAASRAVNYKCDSAGTALNYAVLNKTVGKMRACAPAAMGAILDEESCLAEIRDDFKKRG